MRKKHQRATKTFKSGAIFCSKTMNHFAQCSIALGLLSTHMRFSVRTGLWRLSAEKLMCKDPFVQSGLCVCVSFLEKPFTYYSSPQSFLSLHKACRPFKGGRCCALHPSHGMSTEPGSSHGMSTEPGSSCSCGRLVCRSHHYGFFCQVSLWSQGLHKSKPLPYGNKAYWCTVERQPGGHSSVLLSQRGTVCDLFSLLLSICRSLFFFFCCPCFF